MINCRFGVWSRARKNVRHGTVPKAKGHVQEKQEAENLKIVEWKKKVKQVKSEDQETIAKLQESQENDQKKIEEMEKEIANLKH